MNKVSWEIITNPENDMFRLDELYDERDEYFEHTEDEIEVINMLLKETGN
jgi:hypothetical protein